jgi:Tol biopolymer transport system component
MIRKDWKHLVFRTIGLLMVTLWFAHPLQAATNIKLSGVMPAYGDVTSFQISPNGRYAVYLADQDTDGVFELYSVLLGVGAPVRLNPLLPVGRKVTSFQISPDSSRVVYIANQQSATVYELYSVPIGGPAAAGIKLNGVLVAGGGLFTFLISPDGSRVVYVADQQKDNVFELYAVPIGGPATAGIKLNGALATGGGVGVFKISPDNDWVVYQADQDTAALLELYSVPLGGPATAGIKLNGALVATGGVGDFQISPDSGRVVYRAIQQTATVPELYSVPLGGPAAAGIKLNGTLVAGGNVGAFKISRDSGRVVYIADQDADEVFELYMTSNYLLHLPLILRQG